MHRLLIFLLSLAGLAIPTTSWEASVSQNLAIDVTQGQAITAVSLSNSTFTGGAPSGTVVGAISVTMSPASPAFSGSLSLSGTNASQFQIVGSNLETNGAVPAGTYNVNIVATEAGVTGSPFTQAETVTGASSPPSGVEKPGPSSALLGSAASGSGTYSGGVGQIYTCSENRYVNASTGSDSNNGTSAGSAWATLTHAAAQSLAAGTCVNVAAGTYTGNLSITHGGTTAAPTGYIAYICAGLDTCHIVANGGGPLVRFTAANYVVFDGFDANCNNYQASIGWASSIPDTGTPGYHIWLLNSLAQGCALSGVQLNDSEYYFVLHSTLFNNSHTSGFAGSGLSFATLKLVSGYTPTAADNTIAPFHNLVSWDVMYNNACTSCGTNTDGNGIIMDSFQQASGNTVDYTQQTLLSFNVVYNNGGKGLYVFSAEDVTIANNSAYNNNLDTLNNGTFRYEIGENDSYANTFINNVAYSITGVSAPLSDNSAYGGGLTGSLVDSFANNLSYCTSSFPSQGCNSMYNGDSYSCSSNKCQTTGSWMNVGNTSQGSETTLPNGTNFALQAGSPAIGYGQTLSYLNPQSVDAGACYHTLTSCP